MSEIFDGEEVKTRNDMLWHWPLFAALFGLLEAWFGG